MKHTSDSELYDFLHASESDVLELVTESVHSRWWSKDSTSYFGAYLDGTVPFPAAKTPERATLTNRIIEQLGYFGSHSVAYYLRKLSPFHDEPRVPYHEILSEVETEVYKQFSPKDKPPRIASVAQRERNITDLLMNQSLGAMPEDEIARMLSESGLDMDAAKHAARELSKPAAGGALIFTAIRVLGKKTVRDMLLSLMTAILTKMAEREGAKQAAVRLAKRFPQQAFKRFAGYVGWALFAWDAWMIAGPAKRILIPAVASIAVLRTAEAVDPKST